MKKLLVIVLLGLLAGCGAGPHAVKDATLRDVIFSIETKENGSHFLWMVHDDVGVYCTMNAALFAKAEAIFSDKSHQPEVFIKYISANVGSDENKSFFQDPLNITGCVHDKSTVYVMTDVEPVSGP